MAEWGEGIVAKDGYQVMGEDWLYCWNMEMEVVEGSWISDAKNVIRNSGNVLRMIIYHTLENVCELLRIEFCCWFRVQREEVGSMAEKEEGLLVGMMAG